MTFFRTRGPWVALASLLLAGPSSLFAAEVNIYSARHYDTDFALYDTFTEQTGISSTTSLYSVR